jgi:serine/threonine protein kinase
MKKKYENWEDCIALKELQALTELSHPNIVTLKESILDESGLNLIFEFVGINLYEYMTKKSKPLTELNIRNIIFQILQGIYFMHKNGYFHRDIKPENILINEDIVKIADFG